jgi:hypothetical protein
MSVLPLELTSHFDMAASAGCAPATIASARHRLREKSTRLERLRVVAFRRISIAPSQTASGASLPSKGRPHKISLRKIVLLRIRRYLYAPLIGRRPRDVPGPGPWRPSLPILISGDSGAFPVDRSHTDFAGAASASVQSHRPSNDEAPSPVAGGNRGQGGLRPPLYR